MRGSDCGEMNGRLVGPLIMVKCSEWCGGRKEEDGGGLVGTGLIGPRL